MQSIVQQTDEWLALRKSKIGASDAPVIMEVSPWKTPYQLWLEKISSVKETKKTASMQRGIDLETKAREEFEKLTGIFMIPQVVFHKSYDWMMASLDGMDIEQKSIVEIKCPNKIDHQTALSGNIPNKYYPQLQHQMEVCELDSAYYFSFDGENGTLLNIPRDDIYIKKMLEKEVEFYECMQNFIAPETNEKDYTITNDDLTSFLASKLIDTKHNIRELQKQEKEMTSDLLLMCGYKNTQGRNFKITKTMRKGFVDYTKIPVLEHMDLEQYRKDPIDIWRITNG